ncbi:MAG: hypothetical protein IPI73_19280 [Betaproteobacteria bacterium]|nr:hypothetical protein [Betaproteobacteria bacterium]
MSRGAHRARRALRRRLSSHALTPAVMPTTASNIATVAKIISTRNRTQLSIV